MKQRIIKLKKLTTTKWLNLFQLQYINSKSKVNDWFFVSRKKDPFNNDAPDGIVIIATVDTPEGRKIVVTKEYRAPIRDYEYGFPAGLIDEGMTEKETVKKELKEETGLDLVRIVGKSNRVYSSAGMTDESVIMYFVEADGEISTKYLEGSEDIQTFLYDVNDIREILGSDKKIGAKAWGIFYYYSMIGKIK